MNAVATFQFSTAVLLKTDSFGSLRVHFPTLRKILVASLSDWSSKRTALFTLKIKAARYLGTTDTLCPATQRYIHNFTVQVRTVHICQICWRTESCLVAIRRDTGQVPVVTHLWFARWQVSWLPPGVSGDALFCIWTAGTGRCTPSCAPAAPHSAASGTCHLEKRWQCSITQRSAETWRTVGYERWTECGQCGKQQIVMELCVGCRKTVSFSCNTFCSPTNTRFASHAWDARRHACTKCGHCIARPNTSRRPANCPNHVSLNRGLTRLQRPLC